MPYAIVHLSHYGPLGTCRLRSKNSFLQNVDLWAEPFGSKRTLCLTTRFMTVSSHPSWVSAVGCQACFFACSRHYVRGVAK
jgi:hypothetical protein